MCIKNYLAGATINPYRIVKFSADGTVIQGAAATDSLIGVVDIPAIAAATNRVDVVRDGFCQIEYGGTVTRGDLLTSDSVGRAVTAAPATGVNNRTIGISEVSGVVGDIVYMQICCGSVQG